MIVSGMHTKFADDLATTLECLKKDRQPREPVFQNIINFILPGLEDYLRKTPDGTRVDSDRYGSAGLRALQKFVDGLFGYLISPSLSWHREEMANIYLQDIPEVRQWTQELTEHFTWRFRTTNFYEVIPVLFEHAGALGYGDIFVDKDKERNDIICYNPHPGELFIAENKYGEVDTVFWLQSMTRGNAIEKFGKKVFDEMWIREANNNPYEKKDFLHAVYPRKQYNPNKIGPMDMPFASVWMELEKRKIILQSGYRRNPHHVWRYKRGNTPYGNGPAEDALIEIAQDSEIWRSLVMAAQKSVEPALNVPSELEGQVDVTPSGINYYTDYNKIIRPVTTGIQYPIGADILDRAQAIVEKHFKIEFFMLLAQQEGLQPRTATEIMELQGEKAAVLARPISRLQKDVLDPLFDRYFQIDMELGNLPPMPDILLELSQGQKQPIAVNYIGPLAMAQKRALELQGINAGIQHSAAAAEVFGPEVLDNVNKDKLIRDLLKADGFPQDSIEPMDKVLEVRQARRQAAEQEMQLEGAERQAKIVKDYAQADRATEGKMSKRLEQNAEG